MLAGLSDIEEKKRATYPLDIIGIWGFDSATDEWIAELGLWVGRGLETIRDALTLATEAEQLRKERDELTRLVRQLVIEGCWDDESWIFARKVSAENGNT